VKHKIVVIVGPTASEKSALGVGIARRFGGEIISADSRQVYRGLDIGTGKITKREMRGVPHHMLDVLDPKRQYSAGDFVRESRRALTMIYHSEKVPIVVGGTGFYIDALLGRIALPEVAPNPALRKKLALKSTTQLYAMLKKINPQRAEKMDTPSERGNKIRLIRALEISSSKSHKNIKDRPLYTVVWVGVRPNDAELRTRINKRLRERIKAGMVKEARRLHKAGLSYKRMYELGLEYRSLARHLQGKITHVEMEKELQSDIWRYARKQIGYWKRNKDIQWFDPRSKNIIPMVARSLLAKN
jgi:tRNA dimethylallyltransferase